jgi:SAM-dependent methyltransferase
MDPRSFYNKLWNAKSQPDYSSTIKRDWFHRLILAPFFDPTANPRHQVALRLLRGGHRLLDTGCWNGYLLERIREAGLYQELYGVDIVPEGIETVRAKGFQAQVVDLNRDPLPFPDEYFDGVTLLAVLEHITLLSCNWKGPMMNFLPGAGRARPRAPGTPGFVPANRRAA